MRILAIVWALLNIRIGGSVLGGIGVVLLSSALGVLGAAIYVGDVIVGVGGLAMLVMAIGCMLPTRRQAAAKTVIVAGVLAAAGSGQMAAQSLAEIEKLKNDIEEQVDSGVVEERSFIEGILEKAQAVSNRETDSVFLSPMDRMVDGFGDAASVFDTNDISAEEFADGGALEGPIIYVLVSSSMPSESMMRYVREAKEHGAQVMLRGFIGNSQATTQLRVSEMFEEGDEGGFGIDPRVFKAFGVERVPAIIWSEFPIEGCGGLDCVPEVGKYDIVRGNISISAALSIMGRE